MKKKLGILLAVLTIMLTMLPSNLYAEETEKKEEKQVEQQKELDEPRLVDKETSIEINETNFPDVIFREYVRNNFDSIKDGTLSQEELNNVREIRLSSENLTSLEGVQYFQNLETVYCPFSSITSLDFSNNLKLTTLDCGYNMLSSLDISKNILLTEVKVHMNELKTLDTSNLINLTMLYSSSNLLTNLDLSGNISLEYVTCNDNELVNLDVSTTVNLVYLECHTNQLTNLDLSKNPNLVYLDCGYNQITNLDLSKNLNLVEIFCYKNKLTSLDLTGLDHLVWFEADNQNPELQLNYNIESKKWEVDFNGFAIIDRVLIDNSDWSYNVSTGIATYVGEEFPEELYYEYMVGFEEETMSVYENVSLSDKNNSITGIKDGSSYTVGDTIDFKAIGAAFDKEDAEMNDERYRPATWALNDEVHEWNESEEFHASTQLTKEGSHTLNVTFVKEKYDGTSWKAMDNGLTRTLVTSVKSVTFDVKAKAKETNQGSTTPSNTTKQSPSVATGDNQNIWLFAGILMMSGSLLLIKNLRNKN